MQKLFSLAALELRCAQGPEAVWVAADNDLVGPRKDSRQRPHVVDVREQRGQVPVGVVSGVHDVGDQRGNGLCQRSPRVLGQEKAKVHAQKVRIAQRNFPGGRFVPQPGLFPTSHVQAQEALKRLVVRHELVEYGKAVHLPVVGDHGQGLDLVQPFRRVRAEAVVHQALRGAKRWVGELGEGRGQIVRGH